MIPTNEIKVGDVVCNMDGYKQRGHAVAKVQQGVGNTAKAWYVRTECSQVLPTAKLQKPDATTEPCAMCARALERRVGWKR